MRGPSGRWALAGPAIVLTIVAVVLRVPAISDDGLLFDDAWVAIGGMKASPGELLTVSTMHPGFTLGLMGWSLVTPASTAWITLPAFIVGAATPAIAFLLFRRLGVQWWISILTGVLVAFAPTHIVYSGRVKPYMLETVAILLLAAALGRVARWRWTLRTAAGWVVVAFLFATINAFAFAAIAVAVGILVLHPKGDLPVRLGAAATQGALQLGFLVWVQRSFDAEGLEGLWGTVFDGYVQLDSDPVDMGREVTSHLARVGQMVVHNRWLALGLVVLAAVGLVRRAWKGPYEVMSRFLLAAPALAFVGSIAERMPFGTIVQTQLFPGTRASLWLLPSILAGVAFALDDLDRSLARRSPALRWGGIAAVGGATVAIVVGSLLHDTAYPAPGYETIHAIASEGDSLILVLDNAIWSYAAVPEVEVGIDPLPDELVGFEPTFTGDDTVRTGFSERWEGSPAQARLQGTDAERVVVVNGFPGLGDDVARLIGAELTAMGFEPTRTEEIRGTVTVVWEPAAAG